MGDQLHNIWDVYNELKRWRDEEKAVLEVNAAEPDGGSLREEELDILETNVVRLTRMLADIDRGQGRPTEDEQ